MKNQVKACGMKRPVYSQKSVTKRAYKGRYDFDHVTISKDGKVTGYYSDGNWMHLGIMGDITTVETASGNVQVRNRGHVIYTLYCTVKV